MLLVILLVNLKNIYNCDTYNNDLIDSNKTLSESTMFLFFKEYDNVTTGLCYPTDQFVKTINSFGEAFAELFKSATHYIGINKYIVSQLMTSNLNFLTCDAHKTSLQEDLIKMYVSLMIYYKLKNISKLLNNNKKKSKKDEKIIVIKCHVYNLYCSCKNYSNVFLFLYNPSIPNGFIFTVQNYF